MNITTTTKLLKTFFDGFAPSYLENCVPPGTATPYATFTLNNEKFGHEGLIQLRIFDESTSIENICSLTDRVEEAIGHGGKLINGPNGVIWIYKGSPFAQVEPQQEENLKVMYINLIYRNM